MLSAVARLDAHKPRTVNDLAHLAAQVVQLLWLEDAGVSYPPLESVKSEVFKEAGLLMERLAADTQPYVASAGPRLAALPPPGQLEKSDCLLEAWEEAGFAHEIHSSKLGELPYTEVQKILLSGESPRQSSVRQALLRLFEKVGEIATARMPQPLFD